MITETGRECINSNDFWFSCGSSYSFNSSLDSHAVSGCDEDENGKTEMTFDQ